MGERKRSRERKLLRWIKLLKNGEERTVNLSFEFKPRMLYSAKSESIAREFERES